MRPYSRIIRHSLAAVAVAGFAFSASGHANATTFGFAAVTNNNAGDVAIAEAQIFVDVLDGGGGTVDFTFQNAGPAASSIVQLYWDDAAGVLGAFSNTFDSSAGVLFSAGANPGNLPGGNPVGFSATDSADADNPGGKANNGVQPNEFVTANFALLGGATFNDVLAALAAGANDDGTLGSDDGLRIGIHVQAFASGGSESLVNSISTVPVPAALPLLLTALAGFGYAARRRVCRPHST